MSLGDYVNITIGMDGKMIATPVEKVTTGVIVKPAHLINVETIARSLQAMGFATDARSNNMAALKAVADEFNRAQEALRDEVLNEVYMMIAGTPKPAPVTVKPPATTYCCTEPGCPKTEVTAAAAPNCYTCGKQMLGVVFQVKLPEKPVVTSHKIVPGISLMPTLPPGFHFTEAEVEAFLLNNGATNVRIHAMAGGEGVIQFLHQSDVMAQHLAKQLENHRPAGVILTFDIRILP